jgi:hypothetical protein
MITGVAITALVLFVLYARLFGFNPGATRPGLWLSGEVVTEPITDWSFAEKIPVSQTAIQTRNWFLPILAHSVITNKFIYKGRLYIRSGYPAGIKLPAGRHWNKNILADPYVRIRLAGKLYDRRLVYVTDSAEREELLRANGARMWAPGFYLHIWRVEPLD